VVYDPERLQVLGAASHHMAVDYSAYEAMAVTGAVDTVIARGEIVLRDGSYRGRPGRGRFVARTPFAGLEVPAPAAPAGLRSIGSEVAL